jgi:ubiquinone/menaquinone biosynthesis C-methylase UbiE
MQLFTLMKKIKRLIKPIKPNTIENNLQSWTEWDWSKSGEEWSNTPEWKKSLIENVLMPNIPGGSRILEIGPGAGRWTEYLVSKAKKLTLVDLTPKCIELCKLRFSKFSNIEYFVNDGKDLSFIISDSIDRIWSWDVFVHIQADDIKNYIKEFSRILSPCGQGIIHHSKKGKNEIGWRSNMTAEKMKEFCSEYGLELVKQIESWDDGKVRIWPSLPVEEGPDIISIFRKPQN